MKCEHRHPVWLFLTFSPCIRPPSVLVPVRRFLFVCVCVCQQVPLRKLIRMNSEIFDEVAGRRTCYWLHLRLISRCRQRRSQMRAEMLKTKADQGKTCAIKLIERNEMNTKLRWRWRNETNGYTNSDSLYSLLGERERLKVFRLQNAPNTNLE